MIPKNYKEHTLHTKRLSILPAQPEDIEAIIALESHPENRNFLWVGTREEHLQEIDDPCHLLLVFRDRQHTELIGYALIRLDFHSRRFEIRRIAIDKKGKGYGKEAMQALLSFAFCDLQMNKVWLDVYPHNTLGIQLYENLGFQREGILRENYFDETLGYLDQMIYSMLKGEFQLYD
jgi:ribosomal-protein-alanine N-acetyltransferase